MFDRRAAVGSPPQIIVLSVFPAKGLPPPSSVHARHRLKAHILPPYAELREEERGSFAHLWCDKGVGQQVSVKKQVMFELSRAWILLSELNIRADFLSHKSSPIFINVSTVWQVRDNHTRAIEL